MKNLLTLLSLGCALTLGVAHATTPAQAAQQGKMKACNVDAKSQSLKGDAHAAFMKTCLSKQGALAAVATPIKPAATPAITVAAAPVVSSQQSKMKTCNMDAGAKKLAGDARKQFMSSCLKG